MLCPSKVIGWQRVAMPDLVDLIRDKMAAMLEHSKIRYSQVHYLICPFVGTTEIMYTNAANTKRHLLLQLAANMKGHFTL